MIAHGRLLQASYVNFYLCNGGVVMPAFDDPHDEQARAMLADCFPGRDILQMPALDIVAGGGGIHCITQQEPGMMRKVTFAATPVRLFLGPPTISATRRKPGARGRRQRARK